MDRNLLKALADAYESGGALACFADEPDVRIGCMDATDRRYAQELRGQLRKMDYVLDQLGVQVPDL